MKIRARRKILVGFGSTKEASLKSWRRTTDFVLSSGNYWTENMEQLEPYASNFDVDGCCRTATRTRRWSLLVQFGSPTLSFRRCRRANGHRTLYVFGSLELLLLDENYSANCTTPVPL